MPIPDEEYDDICRALQKVGAPITRENWIALAYGVELRVEWTWEHEEELPEFLQAGFDGILPQPL